MRQSPGPPLHDVLPAEHLRQAPFGLGSQYGRRERGADVAERHAGGASPVDGNFVQLRAPGWAPRSDVGEEPAALVDVSPIRLDKRQHPRKRGRRPASHGRVRPGANRSADVRLGGARTSA